MGNESCSTADINPQRFSSISNDKAHHSKRSTMIKPPNDLTSFEYSHSGSLSKSKSKSKTKSKSKSKKNLTFRSKSNHLSLPDINPEIGSNGSYSISAYTISGSSAYSSRPITTIYQHEKVDLSKINNGITGTYISARVVKIAAEFWEEHISCKCLKEQLEIGCAMFFGMMVHDAEMKRILQQNLTSRQSIENSSIKFLDMMAWLLRSLMRSDINLATNLEQLGIFHRKMGVNINHFDPMLNSMHETFSYYFPIKYGIQIKYAIDQIFALAARIMTGQDLKEDTNGHHLANLQEEMHDGSFLISLSVCLHSGVGKEYLYRFLQQTFCDEIAIFLQSVSKFKLQTSDKERFMIARSIVKNSIEPAATFAVNISYETRSITIADMVELERIFFEKSDELKVAKDMFEIVEKEIHKLIMDNHWRKFTQTFKNLEANSV